jgi:hypothetical protein
MDTSEKNAVDTYMFILRDSKGDRYDETLLRLMRAYRGCDDNAKEREILDYAHVVERNKYAERKEHKWW